MVLCAPAERPIEIVPEPEHPIPYHSDRRRCPLLETTVWIFAQVHEMPETASTVAGVPPLRLSNTHKNTTPLVGERKFVVNDDAVPPFPVSRVDAARAGWSMVKSDEQRTLLWNLDNAIQALTLKVGQTDPEVVSLAGSYHNLLRMWAEV